MKKWTLILLFIFFIFLLFNVGCLGKEKVKFFKVTEKNLVASPSSKAIVEGKIRNEGKESINTVLIKAQLIEEGGNILEEPYEMVGPIQPGEEIPFKLNSYTDYYRVKKFKVFIDSAD